MVGWLGKDKKDVQSLTSSPQGILSHFLSSHRGAFD